MSKYCWKCGAEVNDESRFCDHCGSDLSEYSTKEKSRTGIDLQNHQSGVKKVMIVAVVLFLFWGIVQVKDMVVANTAYHPVVTQFLNAAAANDYEEMEKTVMPLAYMEQNRQDAMSSSMARIDEAFYSVDFSEWDSSKIKGKVLKERDINLLEFEPIFEDQDAMYPIVDTDAVEEAKHIEYECKIPLIDNSTDIYLLGIDLLKVDGEWKVFHCVRI